MLNWCTLLSFLGFEVGYKTPLAGWQNFSAILSQHWKLESECDALNSKKWLRRRKTKINSWGRLSMALKEGWASPQLRLNTLPKRERARLQALALNLRKCLPVVRIEDKPSKVQSSTWLMRLKAANSLVSLAVIFEIWITAKWRPGNSITFYLKVCLESMTIQLLLQNIK